MQPFSGPVPARKDLRWLAFPSQASILMPGPHSSHKSPSALPLHASPHIPLALIGVTFWTALALLLPTPSECGAWPPYPAVPTSRALTPPEFLNQIETLTFGAVFLAGISLSEIGALELKLRWQTTNLSSWALLWQLNTSQELLIIDEVHTHCQSAEILLIAQTYPGPFMRTSFS